MDAPIPAADTARSPDAGAPARSTGLALRLIVALTVLVAAVEGVFGWIGARTQERQLVGEVVTGADQLSRSIASATWHAMRADRRADAYEVMSTIAAKRDVERIRLINKSGVVAFLLIAAAWVIVAGYTSINAVVKAELFPTAVRATGVGLPYAVTVSIFGGTAESIARGFKSIGHENGFYFYLTGVIFASLLVYATMRDTRHESAMGRHV